MSALKMMAMDGEDLTVVSAHCQDSVFKSEDISWLAAENRFLLSINRFVWEKAQKRGLLGLFRKKTYERHRAVLHFEQVASVQTLGLNPKDENTVYSLLSIEFFPSEDGVSGQIELMLADEYSIRLNVDSIEARLTDFDAAWETKSRPKHPLS
ncbi:MAG: DUF2948 family protein [Hyphomicrobiales bacterium]